jgi:peptide/nickel transport system substrate-binding protein
MVLPIYTPGMSQAQKVSSAREAALGFFEAAGFTVSGGMVVAAPAGAKLNYEVIVPGGGTGEHPAYGLLVAAQETLSEIGITLYIYEPS